MSSGKYGGFKERMAGPADPASKRVSPFEGVIQSDLTVRLSCKNAGEAFK